MGGGGGGGGDEEIMLHKHLELMGVSEHLATLIFAGKVFYCHAT